METKHKDILKEMGIDFPALAQAIVNETNRSLKEYHKREKELNKPIRTLREFKASFKIEGEVFILPIYSRKNLTTKDAENYFIRTNKYKDAKDKTFYLLDLREVEKEITI
jgi:hypothetical protein